MKRFKFIPVLALLLTLGISIQAQGIQFEHGSLSEATTKASEEGKLVFLDAYAVWCGPCKWMAKNAFMDQDVAAFFNEHFVSLKMDMEKGEGPALSRKLGLTAYPTLYFLDGNGEVVKKSVGALDARGLLALGKKVAKKNNVSPEPSGETGFNEAPDQLDPDAQLNQDIAQEEVDPQQLYKSLMEAAQSGDEDSFEALREQALDSEIEYSEAMVLDAEAARHLRKGEMEQYTAKTSVLVQYYGKGNVSMLNNRAWEFYQNVEDPEMLERAAGWAMRSLELERHYYNLDTYAMLQYKLGNTKEAIRYAKIAIAVAKESGEDYSVTQKVLEEMENHQSNL